ncbi:MAG: peptidoglycan DD-metalloendopeptidase family protein [Clostridiaceae bacterium]
MDNKFQKKSSNFFKKEGFYVLLFVCICVVATLAAVTARKNNSGTEPLAQVDTNNEYDEGGIVINDPTIDYQNALEVQDDTQKIQENKEVEEEPEELANNTVNDEIIAVTSTKIEFGKPVDGGLARAYSEDPVKWSSTDSMRPNFGVDIKADVGSPVYSVLDGTITSITSDVDGKKVTIDHGNGFVSIYANLDNEVTVEKGKEVKIGDQIGKVGNTTLNAAYEEYGDHLHFEIKKDNKYEDPAKYISKYLK